MGSLAVFYTLMLVIQLIHSIEELTHDFHKEFPPFKMSFRFFLGFEVCFFAFWLAVFVIPGFYLREQLMAFFVLLMFANGLWHLVWAGIVKKYVPGLFTAPLFIVSFAIYYFSMIGYVYGR